MNRANNAGQLQPIDFTALKLLVEQLSGFVHAERQRFVVNVLHDHRHAFPGGLIRDTATHDPGPQHGGLFRRLNVFGQLLRFGFDILIVKEDTDQRAGLFGVRQRDKTLVFQIQRLFAAETSGRFDGFTAVIGAG